MTTRTLKILPQHALVKTGPVDHAAWSYRGLLGWLIRRRFELVRRLMGAKHYDKLLEVGYGSGVFMPELASSCNQLFGVDVHGHADEVRSALAREGVAVTLRQGWGEAIPFETASFDAVVAVSVLEFVDDIDAVCRELSRVLAPGGELFVVTPGISPLLDLGLKVLTGKSAEADFANRRELVLPALYKTFRTARRITFPGIPLPGVRAYTALKLVAR